MLLTSNWIQLKMQKTSIYCMLELMPANFYTHFWGSNPKRFTFCVCSILKILKSIYFTTNFTHRFFLQIKQIQQITNLFRRKWTCVHYVSSFVIVLAFRIENNHFYSEIHRQQVDLMKCCRILQKYNLNFKLWNCLGKYESIWTHWKRKPRWVYFAHR